MKLSDYIVNFFYKNKILFIFGYIGGAITHIVDSIYKNKNVNFIPTYHEQTASIAAEGYSRNSDRVGVAIATSGPGATNLITGIADAYFDSIPAIYITGQVNTYEFKYDKPIRQQGFQETDIVSIVKPITKYCELVDDPKRIKYCLEKAIFYAKKGRPGPVLLDIPMDIQRAQVNPDELIGFTEEEIAYSCNNIPEVSELIREAKRPLILCGGGIVKSNAQKELVELSERYSIPVVVSLMGKGGFPENHELFIGLIGSYGNRASNIILANTDCLLSIGSRLDTRQTGTLISSFVREGKIIHVDIDKNELDFHRIERDIKIHADARIFIKKLLQTSMNIPPNKDWLKYVKDIKNKYNQDAEIEKNIKNRLPYAFVKKLEKYTTDDTVFTVDTGQNQIILAQYLKVYGNMKYFTSGGMAPLGYSIPAAIGASFACHHSQKVFAIVGDGGFHISLQSLQLISQYNLPVKVIVFNNRSLGMIAQFQNQYFNKNKCATVSESGYLVPNIKKIAEAYELPYFNVNSSNLNDDSYLQKIFADMTPGIIELQIGEDTVVYPKLDVNTPIEDLSPKLDKKELQENMIIDILKSES